MREVLPLLVIVLAIPLLGCIGDDSPSLAPQSPGDGTQGNATPGVSSSGTAGAPGNPAEVHRLYPAGAEPSESEPTEPRGQTPIGMARSYNGTPFEPTIGVNEKGTIFVSNSGDSISSDLPDDPDTEYSSILRSQDQGRTWEDVTGSLGPVSSPPDSFDPYIYVDEDTGRVYNLDMIGLQCNWIGWSDDEGESWTSHPLGCGHPIGLQDHPTIFSGPPGPEAPAADEVALEAGPYENVVYICVNRVVAETGCTRSLDGGYTWGPWRDYITGLEALTGDTTVSGGTGHGVTDPNGVVYLGHGLRDGPPIVTASRDDGLTWDATVVSEDATTYHHDVNLATDEAGTVYAVWTEATDFQPYLSFSTDEGATWSPPLNVAPPGVNMTSHVTIAAEAEGSIAIAYVGTETDGKAYMGVPSNTTWNGYMTIVTNATQEGAVASTVMANHPDHPIGKGVCGGVRCYAADGGGIGDFIDITIDDQGRPWAPFVDVCHDVCETSSKDPREESRGLLATLAQGPSLVESGEPLPPLEGMGAAPGSGE